MQEDKADMALSTCWQSANFTGAAFGGKLKKLDYYKQKSVKSVAPQVSKDDFDKKLAEAERRMKDGSTKS